MTRKEYTQAWCVAHRPQKREAARRYYRKHRTKVGKKKFALSTCYNKTLEAVGVEIAKCDPVCANCHRERTHGRSR